jgi:FAD/FMN-containing dehydrogenase|tara:strand:- start:388 stop:1680 length:1293 start_codon:yes stop_codon:yes gene_type:complete
MSKLSSWGNTLSSDHEIYNLQDKKNAQHLLSQKTKGIVYGMGRSYGDVCLNPGGIAWKSSALDRLIAFDEELGILECESGISLQSIQDIVMPRGWMLPVSPGSQYISVGGAIANDVHGKNHHKFGTFGNHVLEILLLRSNNKPILCSPEKNLDWFKATIGGIGLTGIIFSCKIQLRKVEGDWLEAESIPFKSLSSFLSLSDSSESDWEYTAAWIDCLSRNDIRGIFERGRHTSMNKNFTKRSINFAFTPPFSVVNRVTLSLFNPIYFFLKTLFSNRKKIYYTKFLHPLDNILNWNRMYGPKGFYQFQCVIPRETCEDAIEEMLGLISLARMGSFLAVLKTFSNFQPVGLLSFACPGITLALDFPNKGEKTKQLFSQLEDIVKNSNGRIYLAKDILMTKEIFECTYPESNKFKEFRDPNISSQMSKRLLGG